MNIDEQSGPGLDNQPGAHLGADQWDGRSNGNNNERSVSNSEPSFDPSKLDEFVGTDYELIKLHCPKAIDRNGRYIGKTPLKGWRKPDAKISIDEAKEHLRSGSNVGVRLSATDLVLDVDPRNFPEGQNPLDELGKKLKVEWHRWPCVMTGSGGFHYYMSKPEGIRTRETLDDYPGLEFKTLGRQMVSPGSVHPATGKTYEWDPIGEPLEAISDAPGDLLKLLERADLEQSESDSGEYSPEELEKMLTGLDACDFRGNDKWLPIMMACHHATAGEGADEFIAWSISDPAYADDEWVIRRRWDSLSASSSGPSIKAATLLKALHKAGNGHLIPRPHASEDFKDEPESSDVSGKPDFADQWVYVADADMFVRRTDGKKWKREQWKSFFAGHWPEGDILAAVWKDKLGVRKFESLVYLPGKPEFPDGENGRRYNIWRDSSVTARPGDVSLFLEHIEYLFPDETEREYVLDYLAMLIQKPGQKINYALLIKGSQGTGKSWIGRLMTRIIGRANVTVPSNDEVRSKWTVWTEGANLGIIEELMAVGRLDMANRLKPIITEPFLRIEDKGSSLYSIPNKLNLIALTNHDDALPIEQGDRRWLIVFSEAEPRDEDYYDSLFRFLDGQGPAAVKDWLLKRDVDLSPNGMAPRTRGKEAMQNLSLDEAERYLIERHEEKSFPFDFELFRFEDVMETIPIDIARRTKNLRGIVARFLQKRLKAEKHGRFSKDSNDGRTNSALWSIDNHDQWEQAKPAGRANAFFEHQQRSKRAI